MLLNDKKFNMSLLGAVLVITGVVIKNSLEQMNSGSKLMPLVGMGCFVSGWIVVAYSVMMTGSGNVTSFTSKKSLMVMGAVASIVLSVMAMKGTISTPLPKASLGGIFAVSWLVLGYSIGMGQNKKSLLGLSGALMVLASMMVALPMQRAKCVTDGPGYSLFTTGWFALAIGNSLM
jgi:hypothetical protein